MSERGMAVKAGALAALALALTAMGSQTRAFRRCPTCIA
jgi:hypothetical protein